MPVDDHLNSVLNFAYSIIHSFSGMNTGWCVLAGMLVFSAWETRHPARHWPKSLVRQSYKVNASLFIANNLMVSSLSLPGLLTLAEHWAKPDLAVTLPLPGQAILSFLLFDLSLYLWHRASHRSPWLWQFHRIHHSDITMNVTTAFRLHIMDHLTMAVVKAAYIVLFGFSKESVLFNEMLGALFLVFHHSNIDFKREQWLGNLIITPNLHRLHHSAERHEHDRNYGSTLSVWDRLFNTLAEARPKHLGIQENMRLDWWGLLIAGFTAAKPTQRVPAIKSYELDAMIAEAAYYKAERRNFKPGYELSDWLEAKREIINPVNGQPLLVKRTRVRLTNHAL